MSGTIEVADPVLSTTFHAMNVFAEGICSTRIDFQLGTNGGNTNGLLRTREAMHAKVFTARRVLRGRLPWEAGSQRVMRFKSVAL
jgi:hypothetical protein